MLALYSRLLFLIQDSAAAGVFGRRGTEATAAGDTCLTTICAPERGETMDTRAVVEKHLDAVLASDVERTLEDYTEESVLLAAGTVFRGIDALREVFEGAYLTLFKPGTFEFTLDSNIVEGEHSLITWHLRFEGGDVPFGFDSFVVRDGKIIAQTGGLYLAGA
jgi:ketosteroid isomerase-like protein